MRRVHVFAAAPGALASAQGSTVTPPAVTPKQHTQRRGCRLLRWSPQMHNTEKKYSADLKNFGQDFIQPSNPSKNVQQEVLGRKMKLKKLEKEVEEGVEKAPEEELNAASSSAGTTQSNATQSFSVEDSYQPSSAEAAAAAASSTVPPRGRKMRYQEALEELEKEGKKPNYFVGNAGDNPTFGHTAWGGQLRTGTSRTEEEIEQEKKEELVKTIKMEQRRRMLAEIQGQTRLTKEEIDAPNFQELETAKADMKQSLDGTDKKLSGSAAASETADAPTKTVDTTQTMEKATGVPFDADNSPYPTSAVPEKTGVSVEAFKNSSEYGTTSYNKRKPRHLAEDSNTFRNIAAEVVDSRYEVMEPFRIARKHGLKAAARGTIAGGLTARKSYNEAKSHYPVLEGFESEGIVNKPIDTMIDLPKEERATHKNTFLDPIGGPKHHMTPHFTPEELKAIENGDPDAIPVEERQRKMRWPEHVSDYPYSPIQEKGLTADYNTVTFPIKQDFEHPEGAGVWSLMAYCTLIFTFLYVVGRFWGYTPPEMDNSIKGAKVLPKSMDEIRKEVIEARKAGQHTQWSSAL